MYCGPTFASIHGLMVPTYLCESRKLVSDAPITVTGRGEEASATVLTFDSACRTSASPSPSITTTPAVTTSGITGERFDLFVVGGVFVVVVIVPRRSRARRRLGPLQD